MIYGASEELRGFRCRVRCFLALSCLACLFVQLSFVSHLLALLPSASWSACFSEGKNDLDTVSLHLRNACLPVNIGIVDTLLTRGWCHIPTYWRHYRPRLSAYDSLHSSLSISSSRGWSSIVQYLTTACHSQNDFLKKDFQGCDELRLTICLNHRQTLMMLRSTYL